MIPDLIGKGTCAGHIQRQIRWAQGEEHRLLLEGDRNDPVYLPFLPYQIGEFTSILTECTAELNGPEFLDVGCGTGTKMMLARELFGLSPHGVEINIEMAVSAGSRGAVVPGDALQFRNSSFYGLFDLIWLYRPFREASKEAELERILWDEMKPGAILAGGSWENCPAEERWTPIVDDWLGMRCGAWQKP